MELVIASNNLHKIREFREILKVLKNNIDISSLCNFPEYIPPEEVGKSFEENARLKAEHAAKALNAWVLSDDSGLVVPALDGAPGILSRRYSGEDATDSENRKKLLQELKGKNGLERAAYYECCLALANPEGVVKVVTGICEGLIVESERGRNGFGYDPLFLKHEYSETFAELGESTKNRVSHRKKAIEKMLPTLERLR